MQPPSDAASPSLVEARAGGQATDASSPARLHILTFFRFAAALWLLASHLLGRFPFVWHAPWVDVVANGLYAMSFFFVLSGTVLVYGYYQLSATGTACLRFYTARFARIYPAYAVVHLVCLLWLPVDLPTEWMRWLVVNGASALCIQAWIPHTFVGANTGTWSISCEFFFYATFPAFLPPVRVLAKPAWMARTTVYLVLLIGGLGMIDFVFAGQGTFPVYYISPFMRLPEFLLGMVLGAALRQMPPTRKVPLWAAVASAGAVLLVSMNTVYRVGLWTRANIIVVPAIACLIYWSAAYELSRPAISRQGIWRVFCYLGEASYCFFLAQLPVLAWLEAAAAKHAGMMSWAAGAPLAATLSCTVLVFGLAIALHEGVEKPARRWILRRSAEWQAKLAAAALPAL